MQRKKLPIGIQTFQKIRLPKDSWVYIDKTEEAYDLVNNVNYCFLSRPRRFGKSLFLDTLSEIFKGSKELFEGLYIYDKWDWEQQFPIVKIDFTAGSFSTKKALRETLNTLLEFNCETLGLDKNDCYSSEPGLYFQKLIRLASQKHQQKIVVLIDEYDKAILDNIGKEDKTMALEARETLRSFYSAIKASDKYLRFVFITGVSKFSKLNLFSGLNNIHDITINEKYATITGYTQEDLETAFKDHLVGVDIEEVKKWYNGYNYFGSPIYNPYDILLFLSGNCKFRNYWWQTGNPSFLIEKLKNSNYFLPELENIIVSEETLNAFDVEHIDLTALLWQTGYLTFDKEIVKAGRVSYKLKVPNLEIQNSLNTLFLDYLTNSKHTITEKQNHVFDALEEANIEQLKDELISLFASIPYENYVKNNISNFEGYYASVMFAFLSSVGYPVKTEESTNRARIDMTVIAENHVFIFEFKVDKPTEKALHQIETKKYYEKYTNLKKEIILIGIHFSSEKRNIVEMVWKSTKK